MLVVGDLFERRGWADPQKNEKATRMNGKQKAGACRQIKGNGENLQATERTEKYSIFLAHLKLESPREKKAQQKNILMSLQEQQDMPLSTPYSVEFY